MLHAKQTCAKNLLHPGFVHAETSPVHLSFQQLCLMKQKTHCTWLCGGMAIMLKREPLQVGP